MDPLSVGFVSVIVYNMAMGIQHDPKESPEHHYAEIQCMDEGHSWPGLLVDEEVAQVRASEFVLCIEEKVNRQLQNQLETKMKSDLRLREIEVRLQEIFKERERLMKEKESI